MRKLVSILVVVEYLWEWDGSKWERCCSRVSILVVVEYLWEYCFPADNTVEEMMFQSLLWWNTSENGFTLSQTPPHHTRRFNPCCGGIPLRIGPDVSSIGSSSFVSILVVVEYLWESPTSLLSVSDQFSFNPCCGGIPLRIASQPFLCQPSQCVSILVVVEYLWECYGTETAPTWIDAVSILVVVEYLWESTLK